MDVINLSLGGPPDELLSRLVAKALESNILVVGAVNPDSPGGFPSGVEGVIAVANATAPRSADTTDVLTAPGNQVLSARPNADYDFYTGSSFSAAQVSWIGCTHPPAQAASVRPNSQAADRDHIAGRRITCR